MKIKLSIFLFASLFFTQFTFAQGEPIGNISTDHIQQDFLSQWEDDTDLDDTSATTGTGTSISSVEFELEVKVFPNPVSDFLQVKYEGSEELQIEIFNLSGHNFQSITSRNGDTNIDLQNLVPGNYYVKISAGNKMTIQKIIKIE